jgi:hypothetical protein
VGERFVSGPLVASHSNDWLQSHAALLCVPSPVVDYVWTAMPVGSTLHTSCCTLLGLGAVSCAH